MSNFAQGPVAAPREGRIVSNQPASAWTAGRFGRGFAGLARTPNLFNRVETGWAPGINGDFSCAFFLRVSGTGPAPSDNDLIGVPVTGGSRIHSGGSVLMAESVDASRTTYSTNANIWQMASSGWVHVVFVVDTNRGTATFYVNGARDATISMSGGATISAADFWIGQHDSAQRGSVYDLDEVRVLLRAATPIEVQTWAQDSLATDTEFGVGCRGVMRSLNGPPQLGNGSYAMVFGSLPNALGMLAIGGSWVSIGTIPLPFDLGVVLASLRGCLWYTSSDLTFPFALDGQGGGAFGLGVPSAQVLLYRPLYLQALFTDGASEETTNAVAVSIGR